MVWTVGLLLALTGKPARPLASTPPSTPVYPVCTDTTAAPPPSAPPELPYRTYLPLVFRGEDSGLPVCTVYCGLLLEDDPYRPDGYHTYFADEFDCNRLLDYQGLSLNGHPPRYPLHRLAGPAGIGGSLDRRGS